MTYKNRPHDFERVRNDNMVVGYYNGKAIVKNEYNNLFFIECEEAHAPIGTVTEDEALTSIALLDEKVRKEIIQIYTEMEDL